MKYLLWLGLIGLVCNSALAIGDESRYGTKEYWPWYGSTRRIVVASFSPMSLNPTGAFATHRMTGVHSDIYPFLLRGTVSGELWIWDFEQYTSNYKTSQFGDWIDGSGEDWYVVRWTDQLDVAKNLFRTFASFQPKFEFNAKNGWPIITWDPAGSFHNLLGNMQISSYIDNSVGYIFQTQYYDHASAVVSNSTITSLFKLYYDSWSRTYILRGDWTAGDGDRIYVLNNDGDQDTANSEAYSIQTWYTVSWEHYNGNLYTQREGTQYGPVASGDTSSLVGTPYMIIMQNSAQGYQYGSTSMLLFFGNTLSANSKEKITDYCDIH